MGTASIPQQQGNKPMAQPIPLEIAPGDPRRELQCRLENAPVEHAEALLAAYDLLQELHDRGTLEMLRGVLGAGDKIIEDVVQLTNTPEGIQAIRNTVILIKTIGALDPDTLNAFIGAMPEALCEGRAPNPPSLWQLINKFRSKHFRRGMAMVNSLLEGFGRNMSKEQTHENK
jgi:uncharacterized protein YjgD (DUF1641 family)